MSKNGTKPAVGYIRMSSDQQQDSPARQRKDIQALADRAGYRIVCWYEDHGLTGTESSNRKDFQKLLVDAKSGSFCAVLLSEQRRMSREDVFDAMVHWKLLRDAGVKIVTCQRGELDFCNLGGVITAIVDQYGAREESIRLAERVISGKRLAISRGQKQGGPPFGYDREILDLDRSRRPPRLGHGDVSPADPMVVAVGRLQRRQCGRGGADDVRSRRRRFIVRRGGPKTQPRRRPHDVRQAVQRQQRPPHGDQPSLCR